MIPPAIMRGSLDADVDVQRALALSQSERGDPSVRLLADVRTGHRQDPAVMRLLVACFAIACSTDPPPSMIVYAAPADEAVVSAFVDELPIENVRVEVEDDPTSAFQMGDAPQIAVVADLDCTECYRI